MHLVNGFRLSSPFTVKWVFEWLNGQAGGCGFPIRRTWDKMPPSIWTEGHGISTVPWASSLGSEQSASFPTYQHEFLDHPTVDARRIPTK